MKIETREELIVLLIKFLESQNIDNLSEQGIVERIIEYLDDNGLVIIHGLKP